MKSKINRLEQLLNGFVQEKRELLSVISDNNWKKEIKIQLDCAELFNSMIGLVK